MLFLRERDTHVKQYLELASQTQNQSLVFRGPEPRKKRTSSSRNKKLRVSRKYSVSGLNAFALPDMITLP